jgi:hypothetical protein
VAVTTPPVPDLQYGSDISGLICAYRFAPDQPGVPIDGAQAVAWLSSAAADGSFVWLQFQPVECRVRTLAAPASPAAAHVLRDTRGFLVDARRRVGRPPARRPERRSVLRDRRVQRVARARLSGAAGVRHRTGDGPAIARSAPCARQGRPDLPVVVCPARAPAGRSGRCPRRHRARRDAPGGRDRGQAARRPGGIQPREARSASPRVRAAAAAARPSPPRSFAC